jgi:hypothetical protein
MDQDDVALEDVGRGYCSRSKPVIPVNWSNEEDEAPSSKVGLKSLFTFQDSDRWWLHRLNGKVPDRYIILRINGNKITSLRYTL